MRRTAKVWLLGIVAAGFGLAGLEFLRRSYAERHTDLNAYVGWANILAFVVAALAFALMLAEMAGRTRVAALDPGTLRAAEASLATSVRAGESRARALLIGTTPLQTAAIQVELDQHLASAYGTAGGAVTPPTLADIAAVYTSAKHRRLLVLGEPGAGKTVLATQLVLDLLEERRNQPADAPSPVPVRCSLSTYDPQIPFPQWIASQLVSRFRIGAQVADALVAAGRILPVLDGLDEMDQADANLARARRTISVLNDLIDGTARAPLVVTCRITAYRELGMSIADADTITIRPLHATEIMDYLSRQLSEPHDELAWIDVLTPLRDAPTGPVAQSLVRVLDTPWVLTLALTAYADGVDPAVLLPTPAEGSDRSIAAPASGDGYITRVKEQLLSRFVHAATRLHPRRAYDDEDDLVRDAEQVQRWLAGIARHLAQHRTPNQSGTDLMLHTWWTFPGVALTRAVHGTIAAVIAAAGALIAVISLLIITGTSEHDIERYGSAWPHLEPPFVIATAVVLAGMIFCPAAAAHATARRLVVPARLDLRLIRSRYGLLRVATGVALGIACGLVAGLAVGLAVGLAGALSIGVTFGTLWGTVGGAAVGLALGLAFGLDRGPALTVHPRQVIRDDLIYGLLYGALVATTGAAAGAITISTSYGVAVGLGVAIINAAFVAPLAATRYGIAVALAAAQRRTPLRLAHFLDWASDAGILRITGTAYQFRHHELQQWIMTAKPT
jgi:hypothetical protein